MTSKDNELINKNAPFYTHQLPEGHPRVFKRYDSTKIENYFPFLIYKDGSYMVAVEFVDQRIDDYYQPLFEKYGYMGSGYNWAGLIMVILKKENPDLLKHLSFDPEGGAFYLFADTEKSQRQFAEYMSNVFKDTTKIESYLKGPDKDKIVDYHLNE